MRYLWPRYLPAKPGPHDFFSPLKRGMLSRLSHCTILEDLGGNLQRPVNLIYVPRSYRDDTGLPLTLGGVSSEIYLSTKYNDLDYNYLKRLGVKRINHALFLDHLERVIANFKDFRSRPVEWHLRLAGVLAEVWEDSSNYGNHFKSSRPNIYDAEDSDDDNEEVRVSLDSDFDVVSLPSRSAPIKPKPPAKFSCSKDRVKSLPVVLLRDGQWVAGNTPNLFLPASISMFELPGGMGFFVIDSDAGQDSRRESLYRLFGAKNFDPAHVAKLIVEMHTSAFNPSAIPQADLISQAKFLFTCGWENTNGEAFL
jgi:hypothetical protein